MFTQVRRGAEAAEGVLEELALLALEVLDAFLGWCDELSGLDADGELVCTSREHTTNSVQPKWTRLAFGMVFSQHCF